MSVNASPAEFESDFEYKLKQLRAHFFQWREVNPGASIYVLLDQNHPVAEHDELHRSQLAGREARRPSALVARPDLAHESELLPILLQLHAAGESGYADEGLLELTLRSALRRCRSVNGAYVCGWLCSNIDIASLATQLAKTGVIFALGEQSQRFLPLFEPYRMALLADDPDSQAFLGRWLAPLKHWMFVDSAGALRVLTPRPGVTADRSPAVLRQTQFAAQARIDSARFVVLALEKSGVLLATQPERRIDKVIAEAQAHGIVELEDLVFYALNSFTIGLQWPSHPQAELLIRRVAADQELRLAAEMSALPDEVLEEIARKHDR